MRRRVERSNHVWSIDFIFDRTCNGRQLKILSRIDEFTREYIVLEVRRTFTGNDLIELLVEVFRTREVPCYIRSDNGPEFIVKKVQRFLKSIDVGTSYIEPASPWQNGFVESFHSRLRAECLACEEFSTLAEAQWLIGRWRDYCNHRRSHGSLDGMTPAEFALHWAESATVAPLPARTPLNANCFTQPVRS